MRKIAYMDGWYATNDCLEKGFMRFFVRVDICNNGEYFYYPLRVFQDGKEAFCVNLYSLADAVSFANNVVSKCWKIEEVFDKYQFMLFANKFCLPKGITKEDDTTISLSPDEVDQAIVEYYRSDDGLRVCPVENVTYNNGDVNIVYNLNQYYEGDSDSRELTKGDLRKVFNKFISLYGYELDDFEFTYEIPDYGHEVKEIKPRYTGARLKVKKLEDDRAKALKYPKNK